MLSHTHTAITPPRRPHPKGQRKRKSDKTAGLVSEFSFPYGEEANPKSQNNREKAVGQPSSATLFEGPDSENQQLDKINEGESNSGDQGSRHVGTVVLCSAAGQFNTIEYPQLLIWRPVARFAQNHGSVHPLD